MKESLYERDKMYRCEILMPGRLIWSSPVPESDCQNRSPFFDTIFEYQANMIPEWKNKSDVA